MVGAAGRDPSPASPPTPATRSGSASLADLDIPVCLLPLTPETRGILGRDTFDALPEGAALVHCGRGEHRCRTTSCGRLAPGACAAPWWTCSRRSRCRRTIRFGTRPDFWSPRTWRRWRART
ncbi:hypothetical protein HK414_22065 [Ramlibacter terrae]|uniref:D-isomer specific 2-hydroxyacid dehydrogenase NAD-binding domain-containing protein n=1 Tax=Ramlibacter terrae TaxID=2732511 RepID=A0ABX6P4U5_9BURK|nr:hypothetical protein HK414_22065 [Ramlibacter terrae]